MYVENYDTLIYGEDGDSPIRKTLVDVLERAMNDKARLRVDVRSIAQGTGTSRSEHTLYMDPNDNDADGLMRILVDRLNASPGEGFMGQIRMNFSPAGNSAERYGSWTRTLKPRPISSGRSAIRDEEEEDVGEDEDDDNSAQSFSRPRSGGDGGGGGGYSQGGQGGGVNLSDDQVRLWLETTMGYVFRSQAQQFAMFERATRMMESYTLRFGFPTHEAGIIEARGGEPPPSAAPGGAGPGGAFGMLPMLLQAAAKLATGGNEPAPAPPPAQIVQAGSAARASSRTTAIAGAGRMIRQLKQQPTPRRPAQGYEPPPREEEEPEETRMERWSGEEEDGGEGEAGEEAYEEEMEAPRGGGGPPDMTGLSPEAMKDAVIQWIRADPSRKADVMNMLPDLSREIT